MSFFEFPHTRNYDSDLGWLIKTMHEVLDNVEAQNAAIELYKTWVTNRTQEIEDWTTEHVEAVEQLAADLQNFVNTYFDNLDVQQEINNKINDMAQDGSLLALLQSPVTTIVGDWLTAHLTPTSPPVDNTLTIAGAAADAKVAGERISDVFSAERTIENDLSDVKAVTVSPVYDTAVSAASTEDGAQIYYNESTETYVKARTAGVAYWKLTTFPAVPYTKYRAYGSYGKNAPIAVFANSNGDYIGSTDTHSEAGYSGTLAYAEFITPADTAYIITNIHNTSYVSTLYSGAYVNILSGRVDALETSGGNLAAEFNEFVNDGEYHAAVSWEQGNLNTNGQPISATNAIRTASYIATPGKYVIDPAGQTIYGYRYTTDGVRQDHNYFWGITSEIEINIESGYMARIVAMNGSDPFTPEDGTITIIRKSFTEDIHAEIDEINSTLGEVDLMSWGDGYFDNIGNVLDPTATIEKYTLEYIPVFPGETITLTIDLSSGKNQWARWIFYDLDKRYMGYGAKPQLYTAHMTAEILPPAGSAYVRISFRSYDMVTNFSLSRENIISSINGIISDVSQIRRNPNCIYAAHQGYDPESVGTETGHNLLTGYYRAAAKGFDAGETDVKFTSDNVPVCCHDGSFTDATTGDTVVIANTTYNDLLTHDYYGGTIASLEAVLKACKDGGMNLIIDQLSTAASDKWSIVFSLVKKYAMADHVIWTLFSSHTAFYAAVHTEFPKASYELLQTSGITVDDMITFANNNANQFGLIYVGVNYGAVTAAQIAEYAQQCGNGVAMAAWTIPQDIPTCKQYMPYVAMITTNRTCYNDVWKRGIE